MSTAVGNWVLVTMLIAAALLLVAELVDHDWLGAAVWVLAIAFLWRLLSRRRASEGARQTD